MCGGELCECVDVGFVVFFVFLCDLCVVCVLLFEVMGVSVDIDMMY